MLGKSRILLLAICLVASLVPTVEAQVLGFSFEPLLPIGKFSKVADIGWGATGYMTTRLGGRKSPWILTADVSAQWHAGDTINQEDYPDLVPPDTIGDNDAVDFSGWMIPIRGSLTRLFGRAYFSPRVGAYIPLSDFKNLLNMDPALGISPKIGYLFFVTREVTADVGIEYTVVFSEETLMYVGFGFGFVMGGERLPRRRIPY